MTVVIGDKPFDAVSSFVLNNNAYFIFNNFMEQVKKNGVRNDGKNELLNLIDKYVSNDKNNRFRKTINKGSVFYRARLIDPIHLNSNYGISIESKEDSLLTKGFDEGNSREAPLGISGVGRNNIGGVSYLYLANRETTACAEVKPHLNQLISLASFKTKRTLHIIDFSTNKTFEPGESLDDNVALGRLFTLVMRKYFEPVTDSSEYRATQIITDYIRKTGIDGIAYRSLFDENGVNYTIFNSDRGSIDYQSSKIMMLQSARQTFLDFNEHRVKRSKTMGKDSYSAENATEMLVSIREEIE
ncbi:MAG: RES family NAD+ phosphorylase [Clostridiales bacterium]|nr:RES family NAD+ phosphorylase [Clostridiales bacterium]